MSNFDALKKVADKLQAIQDRVIEEGKMEDKLYKENSCWCNNNNQEKTTAIDTAQNEIAAKTALIEQADGIIAEKTALIADNKASLQIEKDNLEDARAQRSKENQEFEADKLESISNTDALERAIKILQGFFDDDAADAKNDIHKQRAEFPTSLLSSATKNRIVTLSRAHFDSVQSDQISAFVQGITGGRVDPQSGLVLGMIKQLHEKMTADMAEAKKDENAAVLNFRELAGTKEDTIGELDEAIQQDKTALADARDAKTNGAEDVSATQDQLEKDQAFLATLEETCGNLDDNYAANQKERDHELEALGEVLAALTSDETRGLFARNTETNSFLQVVSKSQDKQARAEAIKVLNTAFRKSGDVALLSLASTVGLDAFQKVKQAIAQLGEAIEQQINDEVIARDTCIATFHDLEIAETEGNGEIKRLNALVESKTAVHTGLVADIAAAEQELGETKQSLQNRGQHYIQGSKEHQKNFEESKAMIGVLEMAKSRLGKFYSPKHPESLTQVSEAPAQTPEKLQKIAGYKKNSASSGVVIYIQQLVDDFKRDIVQREKGAQSDVDQYAKELAELQGSIKALNTKINKKHEEKATVDGEIRDGRKLRTAELDKLQENGQAKAQQRLTCDFLLKYFNERQESMRTEVSAMKEVIAILSGAQ